LKRRLIILLTLLLLLPTLTIGYRVVWLGYPLIPTIPGTVWQFVVSTEVTGAEKGVHVVLGVPGVTGVRSVTDEQIVSGALDFSLAQHGANRLGVWSLQSGVALQTLSYSAQLLIDNRQEKAAPPPLGPYPETVSPEEQTVAEHLARQWSQLQPAARLRAIAESKEYVWRASTVLDSAAQSWSAVQKKYGAATTLVILCRAAGLPARLVQGLPLAEDVYSAPLTWVEAWTGRKWEAVRIATGEIYPNSRLLALARDVPLIQVLAGNASNTQWSLRRQALSSWQAYFQRFSRSEGWLDQWSLFRLPADFQATFRILLLIPISALLIACLRNVVGFPTFGIFMPVLMALAFRNTGLGVGLGIFAGVITIGYGFRRALNSLRLLLVPRLSVLLTLVVASLTLVALIGNRMGLRHLMAVGLLPIVILTMTIERFFVVTEEAGVREGLRTAAGSAAVASITYEIIHWESLQLTFFLYPELISVVAAAQVLLGRYTGFRLGELARFWDIRKRSDV